MPFKQANGLKYFYFNTIEAAGIQHGVFTRAGGISPAPWASLNTGGLSGDSRDNVVENRRRIFSVFSFSVETIFDVWQVHSSKVIHAERPRALDAPHQKGDAIVTNQKGITLFMRFGDCVPILLADPIRGVIGMAHAGWQGTVGQIGLHTVDEMVTRYGCQAENIIAGIGPSIGPDHYQVQSDVVEKAQAVFGEDEQIIIKRDGRYFFNLWEANQRVLERCGVRNIEQAMVCTACHMEDWYSHRGEHGKTGRFGALITLS